MKREGGSWEKKKRGVAHFDFILFQLHLFFFFLFYPVDKESEQYILKTSLQIFTATDDILLMALPRSK